MKVFTIMTLRDDSFIVSACMCMLGMVVEVTTNLIEFNLQFISLQFNSL